MLLYEIYYFFVKKKGRKLLKNAVRGENYRKNIIIKQVLLSKKFRKIKIIVLLSRKRYKRKYKKYYY